jgi:hypothetical protein
MVRSAMMNCARYARGESNQLSGLAGLYRPIDRLAARSNTATMMAANTIAIKIKERIVSSISNRLQGVGPVGRAFARIQLPG